MQGPLAQLIALTCHLNHACATQSALPFFPGNSTCVFCDRIAFQRARARFLRSPTFEACGQTPDEWMLRMLDARVLGARLQWATRHRDDRLTAAFIGGGGTWVLETLHADGDSAFWTADWHVWNHDAPNQRIWRAMYTAGPAAPTRLGDPPDINAQTDTLRKSLTDILAFAEAQQCDPFTGMFRSAISALDGNGSRGYHKDLAPPGILSEIELRVLDACQLASVFGGMGSWNDMGFEGATQDTYRAVSDRLFATTSASIPMAVNGWVHRRKAAPE
jgi:hypothetical protein